MSVGSRVVVFATWSSWRGRRGVVTSTRPLFVLLDGERLPMAFRADEIVEESSAEHVAGAE